MQEFHPQYTEATEQQREPSEYNVNVVGTARQNHPLTITHKLGLGTADIVQDVATKIQCAVSPKSAQCVASGENGVRVGKTHNALIVDRGVATKYITMGTLKGVQGWHSSPVTADDRRPSV